LLQLGLLQVPLLLLWEVALPQTWSQRDHNLALVLLLMTTMTELLEEPLLVMLMMKLGGALEQRGQTPLVLQVLRQLL
jgi:hypothetical protein